MVALRLSSSDPGEIFSVGAWGSKEAVAGAQRQRGFVPLSGRSSERGDKNQDLTLLLDEPGLR